MVIRSFVFGVIVTFLSILILATGSTAQKKIPEVITLKMEGGRLAPVVFNHPLHTDKHKIACDKCHHKDQDPQQPDLCIKCHPAKDGKPGVTLLKDAYHKMCIDCHKEVVAKGIKAPTKCTECHKK
ncbi:MAG: cytochrome c family protein [Desulfobacterota bacterium]|nr:cytochrome c family protein [Thermodesulfobacteriota bacterium]MDW8001761.1 cytochrome c3 family protein [Deltaproteobacteria bacterium]